MAPETIVNVIVIGGISLIIALLVLLAVLTWSDD